MSDTLFVAELLGAERANGDGGALHATLQHLFAEHTVQGVDNAIDVAGATAAPLRSIQPGIEFQGEGLSAFTWSAAFGGEAVRGVTTATQHDAGVAVAMYATCVPVTSEWRQATREMAGELVPDDAWDLPPEAGTSIPGTDDEKPLDAKLPFEVTEDVEFRSPLVRYPVKGIDLVVEVIGHASAVYGERNYGPKILSGSNMLSLWTAPVDGVPIEVANLITLSADGKVSKMEMSMRPWPAVKRFRDRVKARTEDLLGASFFA